MGLIFDVHSARLYESWYRSPRGKAFEVFIEDHMNSLLAPLHGERVLDIGCGAGNHLLYLSRMGLDINGIDASPYMIDLARKRLGSRCSLKTGLAEDLPFEDNEFDVAVMINTLEFLDDPLPALNEAARVTKRKIFIGVINSLSCLYLLEKLQGLFRNTLYNHIRAYNPWELKFHLRNVLGNVPIDCKGGHPWPFSFGRSDGLLTDFLRLDHWPVCSFLVLSAKIAYTIRTDNISLKVRVRKASESISHG